MPNDIALDVVSIREWLKKEAYLPLDFDDLMIKKFLHSCYGSLERTKKCIDRFCTTRSVMTEVYTCRDPVSPKIKTAFSIAYVSTYKAGENEIVIHQIDDPTLDSYVFYDVLKAFSIQSDYWLKKYDFMPNGHIFILDIKDYTLKIIPKVNVMFFRDFIIFLLEGMPIRAKHIHVVNCPSYYEKLYSLVKPVIPTEIRDIIKFHSRSEDLLKHIDKQYLPSDYGGDAPGLQQMHHEWVKEIQENREIFLNDDMWKANLKMKPKNTIDENTMNGSFRTLAID